MIEFTSTVARLVLLVALVALVVLLRRLEPYLPSRRARRFVQRGVVPPVELLTAVSVAVWVFARLVDGRAAWVGLGWSVLFLAIAWTARTAIEDFVSGALLRMEGGVERGRRLVTTGVAGSIVRLGYLSIEIEGDDGAIVRLPWRTVARNPIHLGAGAAASRLHRFTITLPRTRPIERILEEIPAAALVSPWASTTRLPEVRLQSETDQGYVLEVTAHALDARFAPQIEADVRERLS